MASFKVPARASVAGGFQAAEYADLLLAFNVTEGVTTIKTKFSDETQVVRAEVTICEGPVQGTTLADGYIFGSGLVSQLKDEVGNLVLGRITKVDIGGGFVQWQLEDPTPADVETASAFFA